MNERVFEEDALAGVAAWMIDSWNTVGPSARRLIQVPVFDQAPSWWPSWAPAPAKLAIIGAISLLERWAGVGHTVSTGVGTSLILSPGNQLMDLLMKRDVGGMKNYLITTPLENQRMAVHVPPTTHPLSKIAQFMAAALPGILSVQGSTSEGAAEAAALNKTPLIQKGDLYVLHASNPDLLAFTRTFLNDRLLVVANLSDSYDSRKEGIVPAPPNWNYEDSHYQFRDAYYTHKSREAKSGFVRPSYVYSGRTLNRQGGIFVRLGHADAHVFHITPHDRDLPKLNEPVPDSIRTHLDNLLMYPNQEAIRSYCTIAIPWLADPALRKPVLDWLDETNIQVGIGPNASLNLPAFALAPSASEWELLEWLFHVQPEVRIVAVVAFQARALNNLARESLITIARADKDGDTRLHAIIALEPYSQDPAVREMLIEGRNTWLDDGRIRFAVGKALGYPEEQNEQDRPDMPSASATARKSLYDRLVPQKGPIEANPGFALRLAGYGTHNPIAHAWQDSQRYALPILFHHQWLGYLNQLAQCEFLDWLASLKPKKSLSDFSRQPMAAGSVDIAASAQAAQMIASIPQNQLRKSGRTVIIDQKENTATYYKQANSNEWLEDLRIEAHLLNLLYANEHPHAEVLNLDALRPGRPSNALLLRYDRTHRTRWEASPLAWRPNSSETLAQWFETLSARLGFLAEQGWGYVGLTEAFHDVNDGRYYDLEAQPMGVLQNVRQTLIAANVRSHGYLADLSPRHMVDFGTSGPTPITLARVIRDQTFQLGLLAAEVCRLNKFSMVGSPDELIAVLKKLGNSMALEYSGLILPWETQLPLRLEAVAQEILFALTLRQGSLAQRNLGSNSAQFSAPALAAYAQTIARVIVTEIVNQPRTGDHSRWRLWFRKAS